jgi:hypothetical protein
MAWENLLADPHGHHRDLVNARASIAPIRSVPTRAGAPTPNQAVTVYVQTLQVDAGAAGGVSFTPGLKIQVGN